MGRNWVRLTTHYVRHTMESVSGFLGGLLAILFGLAILVVMTCFGGGVIYFFVHLVGGSISFFAACMVSIFLGFLMGGAR